MKTVQTGPPSSSEGVACRFSTLIGRLEASGQSIDFVLIDADHTAAGVRGDIENLLRYRPTERPAYVVMHDSFNPECRWGMKEAAWEANLHVHTVEIDFVAGVLVAPDEPVFSGQMRCGLALAILLPERRAGALIIQEREAPLFQAAFRQSVYRYQKWWNPRFSVPRLASGVRRRLGSVTREHVPLVHGALKNLRDKINLRGA